MAARKETRGESREGKAEGPGGERVPTYPSARYLGIPAGQKRVAGPRENARRDSSLPPIRISSSPSPTLAFPLASPVLLSFLRCTRPSLRAAARGALLRGREGGRRRGKRIAVRVFRCSFRAEQKIPLPRKAPRSKRRSSPRRFPLGVFSAHEGEERARDWAAGEAARWMESRASEEDRGREGRRVGRSCPRRYPRSSIDSIDRPEERPGSTSGKIFRARSARLGTPRSANGARGEVEARRGLPPAWNFGSGGAGCAPAPLRCRAEANGGDAEARRILG
ncbi:hypothetical protein KM043_006125 [Ampulex compressa]|nr:hypothetical protein KM043_006125 [Ampulex compressa]